MSWRTLTPEEAQANPLYGVAGWLYLLFGALVFALIADAVEWLQYDAGSDRPAWLIALGMAVNTAILVAGVRRWRWFPELSIAGIWVLGGLGQVFTAHAQLAPSEPDALDPRQVGLVAFVAFALLFTLLLRVSARVNVTYKHRIKAGAS